MKCKTILKKLPGYLDGAVGSDVRSSQHARIREHLEQCPTCRRELDCYRKLSSLLSRAAPAPPPDDLAVKIRVAVAQARETRDFTGRLRIFRDRAFLVLENVFKPLAVPATGGLFSAMLVFLVMLQMVYPRIGRAVANDVPLNLLRPAEVEWLSEFPVPVHSDYDAPDLPGSHGLLVDVTVNAQGAMVDYQILAGPDDLAVRRQLDQMLLFSRFRPMLSFGRPTPGGHVVLSFNEIRVKG